MIIPESVIKKLDSFLGTPGRPYLIPEYNRCVYPGCMVWSRSPHFYEIWANLSPDFLDALKRFTEFFQQDNSNEDQSKLEEFFSKETPQVRSEFAEYMANIQKLSNPDDAPIKLPEASPAIKEAAKRIGERVDQEDFMLGDEFDFDAYVARIQELWKEESQELQEERVAFQQEFMKAQSIQRNTTRRKRKTLKQVRDVLHGEPVYVYTTNIGEEGYATSRPSIFVVAPTTNQFDIFRYENTNGANYSYQTEDIIEKLMNLDEKFGIDIVGASNFGLEFILKRIPKGKEARKLGEWLLDFCPDLNEAPTSFPRGKVCLWWD